MNKIEWNESLSVWIDEIDAQHKVLIRIMNQAYDYFTKWAKLDIINTEKELWNYTEYHFETEERIMKSIQYPDTYLHIDEHLDFISEITKIRGNGTWEDEIAINVVSFLWRWLYNHILSTDKKLWSFYSAQKKQ